MVKHLGTWQEGAVSISSMCPGDLGRPGDWARTWGTWKDINGWAKVPFFPKTGTETLKFSHFLDGFYYTSILGSMDKHDKASD